MTDNLKEETHSIYESSVKLGRLVTGPAVLASGVAAAATGAMPAFVGLGVLAAGVTYFAKSKDTPEQCENIENSGKYTKFLINGARAISATIGGAAAIATVGTAVLALPVAAITGDIGVGGNLAALFSAYLGSVIIDKGWQEYKEYKKNTEAKDALAEYGECFVQHKDKEVGGILNKIADFRKKIDIENKPTNKLSI